MPRKRIPAWLANLLLVVQLVSVAAIVGGITLLSAAAALIVGGLFGFAAVEAIARSDR